MEGLWKADGRVKEGPGRGYQGPNKAPTSPDITPVERQSDVDSPVGTGFTPSPSSPVGTGFTPSPSVEPLVERQKLLKPRASRRAVLIRLRAETRWGGLLGGNVLAWDCRSESRTV